MSTFVVVCIGLFLMWTCLHWFCNCSLPKCVLPLSPRTLCLVPDNGALSDPSGGGRCSGNLLTIGVPQLYAAASHLQGKHDHLNYPSSVQMLDSSCVFIRLRSIGSCSSFQLARRLTETGIRSPRCFHPSASRREPRVGPAIGNSCDCADHYTQSS